MKTRSIMIQTLCVPCCNRCRYCLLSWDGTLPGASYERCERYAAAFHDWAKQNRQDLSVHFSFGYSMEHPALFRAIDFMRSIGSPGGEFLQMDGMRMRTEEELRELMQGLSEHGVKALNFTFYGAEHYHDSFAGRKGDFALTLRSAKVAMKAGLKVSAGIPVTRENAGQVENLLSLLQLAGIQESRLFIPHEEGRGAKLHQIRCRLEEIEVWSPATAAKLNRSIYRTEEEWLQDKDYSEPKSRMLLLSLTKDNIDHLETTDFAKVIAELEAVDDRYYQSFPPVKELMCLYGDLQNRELFSMRDLELRYRRLYAAERSLALYDVTDERQSGSRRY